MGAAAVTTTEGRRLADAGTPVHGRQQPVRAAARGPAGPAVAAAATGGLGRRHVRESLRGHHRDSWFVGVVRRPLEPAPAGPFPRRLRARAVPRGSRGRAGRTRSGRSGARARDALGPDGPGPAARAVRDPRGHVGLLLRHLLDPRAGAAAGRARALLGRQLAAVEAARGRGNVADITGGGWDGGGFYGIGGIYGIYGIGAGGGCRSRCDRPWCDRPWCDRTPWARRRALAAPLDADGRDQRSRRGERRPDDRRGRLHHAARLQGLLRVPRRRAHPRGRARLQRPPAEAAPRRLRGQGVGGGEDSQAAGR